MGLEKELDANPQLKGRNIDDLAEDLSYEVLVRSTPTSAGRSPGRPDRLEIVRACLAARAERLGWQDLTREHPDLRAA